MTYRHWGAYLDTEWIPRQKAMPNESSEDQKEWSVPF